MVLHGNDRTKHFNPLKYVRDKKKSKDHNTEDVEPFPAPELLLGGTRHTKESDMWAFGALLANLLLGKQLFPGKDRVSKMTQVFKIVGVPSDDNFPDAKRFPFYSSNMYVIGDDHKKKKYSRGVEKAVRHMLKSFENGNTDEYSGFVSLLDGVLHLDPKQRMTAAEALQHPFMVHHAAHVQDQAFRQSYVNDWLELKENVLTGGKSPNAGLNGNYGGMGLSLNGNYGVKESKRKAFVFEASSGDLDDDLYNLDEILGSSPKRPKNLDT
jgi:serine/threonine protein kinase